MDLKKNF